jgi:hypothetical protein
METLDDSTGEKAEKLTNGDDGMESVKLDTEVQNMLLFLPQAQAIRHSSRLNRFMNNASLEVMIQVMKFPLTFWHRNLTFKF